jgi:hypothetical protein
MTLGCTKRQTGQRFEREVGPAAQRALRRSIEFVAMEVGREGNEGNEE